jgi:hypothetical protein
MRTSSRVLLATILATVWWGCGSPSGPTKLLTEIVISGPSQLAPGATAQLRATAKYSDGPSQDITSEATWQSLKPEVLRFANAGSAQALSRGETVISVEFHGVRRTQLVLVMEPGTYKLYGRVVEERDALEGAAIEVVAGTGTGLKTTTDVRGLYALYGVAGSIQVRVSAHGFVEKTLNLTVSTHQFQNFDLTALAASVVLSGSWRLTISAPDACSSKLPEDVRQREFSVSIAQDGTHIAFWPSSPTIASRNPIEGRIFADAFSVNLSFDDYYVTYGLLDRPSPTDWVGIRGTMEGTSTTSSVQGAFNGGFDYYRTVPEARSPTGVPIVCLGSSPFVLTRESARPARRR